jgi:hypothetical protein
MGYWKLRNIIAANNRKKSTIKRFYFSLMSSDSTWLDCECVGAIRCVLQYVHSSHDSVVTTVAVLLSGLSGARIPPSKRHFSTSSGVPYTMSTVVIFKRQSRRNVKLNTHLNLVLMLRVSVFITLSAMCLHGLDTDVFIFYLYSYEQLNAKDCP